MTRHLSGGVEMVVETPVTGNSIAVDHETIYYATPYLQRIPRKGVASVTHTDHNPGDLQRCTGGDLRARGLPPPAAHCAPLAETGGRFFLRA
jgi:hypothetical protein